MNVMHPSHGLRAVRVGSVTGAGLAGWQANSGRSHNLVRKVPVRYWCPQGHETVPVFADLTEAEIPQSWDCPRCGQTAGRERGLLVQPSGDEPFKSHLEYVKERRTPAEAAEALDRALAELRRHRTAPG
ncbi:RNA polymerase-binding protein RbpA [Arthrobacter crystallopoietes]|uniref:RNA polymerase-binding protein RbpA n=1 Tax=Crystallibacter crystallopoietes TaxID=37928 RepID=UPI001ABEE06F|nr:RNA polymerase-binding protein RbpA [Arthrobacter crystallopoietes]QTG80065.1 RNA polymerase-binding protein RbpA [Arthrobacter crystallopoietes]